MKLVKKTVYYVSCTIIIYFLYACAIGNGTIVSTNQAKLLNLDAMKRDDSFVLSSIFKSLKVISLDNKEVLINRIDKMQPYKNHLFILDFFVAKGVFEFDKEGKFIKKFGNIGSGPGEYASCDDFTINEQSEEIYIYDSNYNRINKYDIQSGKYKGSLNLEKQDGFHRMKVNNGRLYAINSSSSSSNPFYILKEIDVNDGQKIGEWMDADQYNKGWKIPFWSNHFFYSIDDKTDLVSFGIADTLMCIRDGELYPYIVLTGKNISRKEEIPKEEILPPNTDPYLKAKKMMDLAMQFRYQDKIIKVSDIYRYKHKLYFKCMGAASYLVEYDEISGKHTVYGLASIDDLMFSKGPGNHSLPAFLNSDKEGVYYYIGVDFLSEFKHLDTEKGVMSDKVINKDKLEKLDDDSNPVILYYEFKK